MKSKSSNFRTGVARGVFLVATVLGCSGISLAAEVDSEAAKPAGEVASGATKPTVTPDAPN